MDGFETKTIIQPINAPWWDNYLTEFFSENIVPCVIRDEQEFTYKMEPSRSRRKRRSTPAPRPCAASPGPCHRRVVGGSWDGSGF